MQFTKLLAPMMMCALVGMSACTSSTNNPSQPDPSIGAGTGAGTGLGGDSGAGTGLGGDTGAGTGIGTGTNVPAASAVPLATTANIDYAANLYAIWKMGHVRAMEDEMAYYAEIAGEFGEVFSAAFLPASRVVWEAQSPGDFYGKQCTVDESTDSKMKRRGCTVSEGTGYGMLISYFAGDVETYTRIWNYSRAYRAYHEQALTPWITQSFMYNKIDNSSATDADLDIATSLVLMYYKYQQPAYLNDALTIINGIWNTEVNKTTYLLYSGDTDMWNGGNGKPIVYNLSYFSPVALRLFAMVDKAHDWTTVLNNMYTYMQTVQAGGTGVFPDWSGEDGKAAKPDNGSADRTYWTFNKESVRIPWRIAWDYYWFQDPRDAAILKTLNNFIVAQTSGNPNSSALSVSYSWNLAVGANSTATTKVTPQWYAAWCLTGIVDNTEWLKTCTSGVNAMSMAPTNTSYFSDILQMSMTQLLNGFYIRPF